LGAAVGQTPQNGASKDRLQWKCRDSRSAPAPVAHAALDAAAMEADVGQVPVTHRAKTSDVATEPNFVANESDYRGVPDEASSTTPSQAAFDRVHG
jgi:hypothetical protein